VDLWVHEKIQHQAPQTPSPHFPLCPSQDSTHFTRTQWTVLFQNGQSEREGDNKVVMSRACWSQTLLPTSTGTASSQNILRTQFDVLGGAAYSEILYRT